MEIVNTIKDGLHLDNNVYDQPENTMRLNMNGVITNVGGNNYKWSNIKGNAITFSLGSLDKYMAHCIIRDRQFIFTYDDSGELVKLHEITLSGYTGILTTLWTISNTEFNFSWDYPIRRIFGFYESSLIQRIYWSDFNNQPRCINIANLPSDNKFIDFFPVIDHVYGSMTKADVLPGGNLLAGSYFFAWRYYTDDGYYSDWSQLSNPVIVTADSPGTTYDSYQEMQGRAPDENTSKLITIEVQTIDTDYKNIQVCAFYSNDYNISIPGRIFYDGETTSGIMEFTIRGNENLGTVTIDDLIISTIRFDNFKDSDVAKKKNVVACINEREELDIPAYMSVGITTSIRELPLDYLGYPDPISSGVEPKALFGLKSASTDRASNILRRGCWYEAQTNLVWYNNTPHGAGNIQNVTAGDIFQIPMNSVVADWDSGDFKAIVLRRKYTRVGFPSEYEFEYLEDDYPDFKSQKVSRWYRSYPQGEKVRLGVLFFDLTGRPFYVRHLRNTDIGPYGPGDVNIPRRDITNPMLVLAQKTGSGANEWYQYASANLQHIIVSDLDITDIKDQISGFMIVRAPIIRQYEAMGVLVATFLNVNDVFSYPGLYGYEAHTDKYYGCYDFYCPEDLFGFKGFSIQPGDELENIIYCRSYIGNESTTSGGVDFEGVGRKESDTNDYYNKFLIEDDDPFVANNSNGDLGASHEILSVTQYTMGQDDISINPIDQTKLYKKVCADYVDGIYSGTGLNATHKVLMLDTGDESDILIGNKGVYDQPQLDPDALICALKRPNSDPYGGYDESSIANTVYMSTGHFQEINATVLSHVKRTISGVDSWVFNGIEIFGGDTFVQLFDLKRLYQDKDGSSQFGHGMIFPVETRINLSMREGNHLAKNRSYDATYATDGLKVEVGSTVLEEFDYNDGYSSDNINDLYVPLPFNNDLISNRDTRIRYSAEKNYGESRDSFRVFLANDYIDLDTTKGAISNIKYKSSRLIYWQPDEVGHIPINERALTESSMGAPVQLGVGGIFERYDQLVDKIGNSHQFGLIESPMGYHWYDSRRKIFISINHGMQLAEDSILKGVDSFFQLNIPDNLDAGDNPFATIPWGVHGGYDPMTKMIFATFNYALGAVNYVNTIGIHSLLNKFIGYYNFYPVAYYTFKDHMYQSHQNKLSVWTHGVGAYNTFFGTLYPAIVSIIIKEKNNEVKLYDTFEIIGNANFFTSIAYSNSIQSITENTVTYTGGVPSSLIRNLKYLKRRWFGNFPKVSRERLSDGYLQVTFTINSAVLVELLEMKTDVRKMM
jgi:hypothetical protein